MRILLLIACGLCFLSVSAQKNEGDFYLLKADGSGAKDLESATQFLHVQKQNDTTYLCRYYQKSGPMIRWETYKDVTLDTPHGLFAWYNTRGYVDSSGYVFNGKKDNDWYYSLDDSGHAKQKAVYYRGKLLERIDYAAKMVYRPGQAPEPLDKPGKEDGHDTTITVVQIAAQFPGGLRGWTKYLERNLKTPDRFLSLSTPGRKASVGVEFFVSKEGNVTNVSIFHSCEWSVDTEAMRVLKESPRWMSAFQNGKAVIYRHHQTITFQVGG